MRHTRPPQVTGPPGWWNGGGWAQVPLIQEYDEYPDPWYLRFVTDPVELRLARAADVSPEFISLSLANKLTSAGVLLQCVSQTDENISPECNLAHTWAVAIGFVYVRYPVSRVIQRVNRTDIVQVYHCLLTMDLEVRTIWRKKMTLGKALYLFTRYTPVLQFGLNLIETTRARTGLGWTVALIPFPRQLFEADEFPIVLPDKFYALMVFVPFSICFHVPAADATMLVCIYALLGAKRLDIIRLGVMFSSFIAPAFFFNYITKEDCDDWGSTVPIVPVACPLWCAYRWDFRVECALLLGKILTTCLAVFILKKHYGSLPNRFISAIWRVGGCYYVTGLALKTILFIMEVIADKDPYIASGIDAQWITGSLKGVERLETFCAAVLSTTLILTLRKVDDPSLREVMSSLVFEIEDEMDEEEGSDDSGNSSHQSGEPLADVLCDVEPVAPAPATDTNNSIELVPISS
ncbi:hypothetical protein NMY22_g9 [Coprinellus aureogranulatus]|nr:hypothetical protein NMY22_g9 [Coprinellus aureogranulatus]